MRLNLLFASVVIKIASRVMNLGVHMDPRASECPQAPLTGKAAAPRVCGWERGSI